MEQSEKMECRRANQNANRTSTTCRICNSRHMLLDLFSTRLKYGEHYRNLMRAMVGVEFVDSNQNNKSGIFCRTCVRKVVEWHEYRKKRSQTTQAPIVSKDESREDPDDDDDDVEFVSIVFDITNDEKLDKAPEPKTPSNSEMKTANETTPTNSEMKTANETTPTNSGTNTSNTLIGGEHRDIDEAQCSTTIKRLKIAFPKLKLPTVIDQTTNLSPFIKLDNKLAQSHMAMLHRKARHQIRRCSLAPNIDLDQKLVRLDIPDELPDDTTELKRLLTSSLELQPNTDQTQRNTPKDAELGNETSNEEETHITTNDEEQSFPQQQSANANLAPLIHENLSLPQDGHAHNIQLEDFVASEPHSAIEAEKDGQKSPIESSEVEGKKKEGSGNGKSASNPSNKLDNTLMTPTATQAIFSCPLCDKAYHAQSSLRRHYLARHTLCLRCDESFKSYAAYSRHIDLHKKEDAMPHAYVRIERMDEGELHKQLSDAFAKEMSVPVKKTQRKSTNKRPNKEHKENNAAKRVCQSSVGQGIDSSSSADDAQVDNSELIAVVVDECNLSPFMQFSLDDSLEEFGESVLESYLLDSDNDGSREEASFLKSIIYERLETTSQSIGIQTDIVKPVVVNYNENRVSLRYLLTHDFEKVAVVYINSKSFNVALGPIPSTNNKFTRLTFNTSTEINEFNYRSKLRKVIWNSCPKNKKRRKGTETKAIHEEPKPSTATEPEAQVSIGNAPAVIPQEETTQFTLEYRNTKNLVMGSALLEVPKSKAHLMAWPEARMLNKREHTVIHEQNALDFTSKHKNLHTAILEETQDGDAMHPLVNQQQHSSEQTLRKENSFMSDHPSVSASTSVTYPHLARRNTVITHSTDCRPCGMQGGILENKTPQVLHVAPNIQQFGNVDKIQRNKTFSNCNQLPPPCQTTYITPYLSSYPQMHSYPQNNPAIVNMPYFTPMEMLPGPYSPRNNLVLENNATVLPAPIIQLNYMNWHNSQPQCPTSIPNQNFVSNLQGCDAPNFSVGSTMARKQSSTNDSRSAQSVNCANCNTPDQAQFQNARNILRVKTTGELNRYTGSF